MARLPRIAVPGLLHHVTQRGNRRRLVFIEEDDYALYRDLLAQHCAANGVVVWAYCLMPNHIHLIVVPSSGDGLSRAVGETHRRYSGYVNARERVTGHVSQGRFGSVAMDETHLLAAFRYVAMNPVKAELVSSPAQWIWSSARAHITGRDDALVTVAPLLERVKDVAHFFVDGADAQMEQALVKGQTVGRPLMSDDALARLEKHLSRRLRPARRGRPKQSVGDDRQKEISVNSKVSP